MTRLRLAAITLGFIVLGAASSFSQTSEVPRSQSTASGSGNSASTGTETNTDRPNLATRRAKKARRHNPPNQTTPDQSSSGTTASGASNTSPGKTKFPGSGP